MVTILWHAYFQKRKKEKGRRKIELNPEPHIKINEADQIFRFGSKFSNSFATAVRKVAPSEPSTMRWS